MKQGAWQDARQTPCQGAYTPGYTPGCMAAYMPARQGACLGAWQAPCWPDCPQGLSSAWALLLSGSGLLVYTFDECPDVFNAPHGCAWPKLERLGITAFTAALPPVAFADGNQRQHLSKT